MLMNQASSRASTVWVPFWWYSVMFSSVSHIQLYLNVGISNLHHQSPVNPYWQFADADAVVKCLASAISTGILLCISPLLFGHDLSFLVLPGTIIILISSWLYIEAAPHEPTDAGKEKVESERDENKLLPYLRIGSALRKVSCRDCNPPWMCTEEILKVY